MRKLLNILGYLLIVFLVYVACINYSEVVHMQVLGFEGIPSIERLGISLQSLFRDTRLTWIILGTLCSGIFVGSSLISQFYFVQKEKADAYKRELEKKMLTNTTSSSKIEVLESKIKTLEVALDNALKNKN